VDHEVVWTFREEKNICQYKDSNPGSFSGWNSLYRILPINKGLDGPNSWSGQFGKQKILSPYKVWNPSWLVGGLVGCLVGWLVGWSVGVLVHRLVSGLVGRLFLLVVGWLFGWWVVGWVGLVVGGLVHGLIGGGFIGPSVGLGLPGIWVVGPSTG